MEDCRWLKPVLVAQIEFLEWTGENHLRHTKFVALARRQAGARGPEGVTVAGVRCVGLVMIDLEGDPTGVYRTDPELVATQRSVLARKLLKGMEPAIRIERTTC